MSINFKVFVDEQSFESVLDCAFDVDASVSDLRQLVVSLFSNIDNDFELQFDRKDTIQLSRFHNHLFIDSNKD